MSTYTHGYHESVMRSHAWRTAENSAAYLLPQISPGLSLLDIGSGAGTITADLAERVAPGRLTAVDVTAAPLEQTRATVAARGLGNVDFEIADVHALRFDDDSFDVVHAHQVLQHVTDPVRALSEMRRVARPGGWVAARDSDYEAFTWHPALPELDEWLALYRRLARQNGGEPDAGRRLLSWALDAGFSPDDVTASGSMWCFATPADRQWWGGMWADRIVDSDIARRAVDQGAATTGDLRRISEAWRRWSASDAGWFAVLHGEILCQVS